jgi:predicted NBD/HSP70 family sugar kinase
VTIESGERMRSVTAELVRRADAGDPRVLRALDEAGASLGSGLASAVNLLDLDAVVLGGCFGPLAPWLSEHVEAALHGRVLSAEWAPCEVRPSVIGELAAVRGAAALTLRGLLVDPSVVAPHAARAKVAVS